MKYYIFNVSLLFMVILKNDNNVSIDFRINLMTNTVKFKSNTSKYQMRNKSLQKEEQTKA